MEQGVGRGGKRARESGAGACGKIESGGFFNHGKSGV